MGSKLLIKGNYSIEEISTVMCSSSFEPHPTYAGKVDVLWTQAVEENEKKGKKIWNGQIYRFESFSTKEKDLLLTLSTIETKYVLPTYSISQLVFHNVYWQPRNMFVAGVTITLDGFVILGKLSGRTLGDKGRVDLLGGSLTKDEGILSHGQDLLKAFKRELKEELGISDYQVNHTYLKGLILTEKFSVGAILEAQLCLSLAEVKALFKSNSDGELAEVVSVRKENIHTFLKKKGSYLPLISEFLL